MCNNEKNGPESRARIDERTSFLFQEKYYLEAIEWYNYSLSLFSSNEVDSKNVAKLQVK